MHKLVPYVRRRPETVIKDRFEQTQQEFAFVLKLVGVLTICTEISVGENFPANDTDIGFYHLQKISGKFHWKVNGTFREHSFWEISGRDILKGSTFFPYGMFQTVNNHCFPN